MPPHPFSFAIFAILSLNAILAQAGVAAHRDERRTSEDGHRHIPEAKSRGEERGRAGLEHLAQGEMLATESEGRFAGNKERICADWIDFADSEEERFATSDNEGEGAISGSTRSPAR